MNEDTDILTLSQWQTLGIKHHHGIALSLSSLHSAESAGCGDFFTLKKFLPFLTLSSFDILQLLPINDTGHDPSPYMGISGFALHPLYLCLSALEGFFDSTQRVTLWKCVQEQEHLYTSRFDYAAILAHKTKLLFHYLDQYEAMIEKRSEFHQFCIHHHSWLDAYATFKALKELHNHTAWWNWEKKYRSFPCHVTPDVASLVRRHKLIQFLCFEQMQSVKQAAELLGIHLMGDLPILLNKDSSDVWANQDLFTLDLEVGAPPDMYSKEGQHWGFPPYTWKEHFQRDLSWQKQRFQVAERLYHIFRLDHIVGFYRFFVMPPKTSPKNGYFIPQTPNDCLTQGEKILKHLISSSSMLPIGEDLGDIPEYVRTSLLKLGIPGTKVMRWERDWQKRDQPYLGLSSYSPESVTTVSTHDSSTLQEWITESAEDVKKALSAWGIAEHTSTSWPPIFQILQASHQSGSLLHINLLQEYLPLVPSLSWINPRHNRINVPGTIDPLNWTFRFKPSIEELLEANQLHLILKRCLEPIYTTSEK